MFRIKLSKFVAIALAINLLLFIIIYSLPFNLIQALIGYCVSAFVFIFGVKLEVINNSSGFLLVTQDGRMLLYQTFYEFLTIIALTIPLYLSRHKQLLKRLAIVLAIMLGYYILLFGLTIILLENGIDASILVSFISLNTDSFMIFAFTLLWAIINKEELLKFLRKQNHLIKSH